MGSFLKAENLFAYSVRKTFVLTLKEQDNLAQAFDNDFAAYFQQDLNKISLRLRKEETETLDSDKTYEPEMNQIFLSQGI